MLKVTVTTVERTAFEIDEAVEVVIPTSDGIITVLPGHIPLVSVLGMGELEIRSKGKPPISLFIDGGILQVDQDKDTTRVEILTNLAERADQLDAAKIEEAKRRAEKLLEEKPIDMDLAKIEASLQKELSRLKLAKKYKPK